MDDYKKRIRAAVENYHHRELSQPEVIARRKNDDPEARVGKEVDKWFELMQWDMGRYEAKSSFNPDTNSYTRRSMPVGVPDRMGITPFGEPVYVELKAPGSRSTFNLEKNYRQRNFLLLKINYGAFACVVDCVDLLSKTYQDWVKVKEKLGIEEAKEYLLNALPQKKGSTRISW